jgi:hypothetical protein
MAFKSVTEVGIDTTTTVLGRASLIGGTLVATATAVLFGVQARANATAE